MELSDRLRTLHPDAQLKVAERVFQRLSLAFGNQMAVKWQGLDMQAVYADWAEALGNCSLGAINHAIGVAKNAPHPPNQGEFVAMCHQYKPPPDPSRAIEDHSRSGKDVSPEQALKNIAKIKEMLGILPMVNHD